MSGRLNGIPQSLRTILKEMPRLAVAYSGGLDSRFLCHAALLCGCDVLAVHASGPHVAKTDSNFAITWCAAHALRCLEICIDPLKLPLVARGARLRCRACKQSLVSAILGALRDASETGRVICDGGNADDAAKYRPGMAIMAAAGILSPIAMAGMGKQQIREAAALSGLEHPDQKARPCLLTRYNYGLNPDRQTLADLAAAEEAMAALLGTRAETCKVDFRLRLLPAPRLHLQAEVGSLGDELIAIAASHGFADCKIEILPDLSGYFDATGSQNAD